MMSWFRAVFCIFVEVSACILQLLEFQVLRTDPSPDTQATFPSATDPSHLQTGRDFATTIQFP